MGPLSRPNSIGPNLEAPLLDLALEGRLTNPERGSGGGEIAIRSDHGLTDLVLQFSVLNHTVECPLADAEHAGGFLPVATGSLQGLLHVIALHFDERPANQAGGTGDRRIGYLQAPERVSLLQ